MYIRTWMSNARKQMPNIRQLTLVNARIHSVHCPSPPVVLEKQNSAERVAVDMSKTIPGHLQGQLKSVSIRFENIVLKPHTAWACKNADEPG